MEKNIYPFDPDVVSSSTEYAKILGTFLIKRSLSEICPEHVRRFAYDNNIDVKNLDPKFVYNWIFQGIADALRNTDIQKKIEQLIDGAKFLDKQ